MLDLNYILVWTVATFLFVYLLHIFRHSLYSVKSGWVMLALVNIALLVAGLLFFPAIAGIVAIIFLGLLIILPGYLVLRMSRHTAQGHFLRALKLAQLLKYLHPFDNTRLNPMLIQVSMLLNKQQFTEAEQLIALLAKQNKAIAAQATFSLKRATRLPLRNQACTMMAAMAPMIPITPNEAPK